MASALFKKFQDEQAKKDSEYKAWENNQWEKNKDQWTKEGYTRNTNTNNAWGSTWSYVRPENPISPPSDPPKDEVELESAYAKAKREGTVNQLVERTQPEKSAVTPTTETKQPPLITEQEFRNNAHFRNHYFLKDNANITIDGKTYPIMVTTGLYNNNYGVENDRTYAFNPETGQIRAVFENFTGMPHNQWATNSEWITPGWMAGPEYEWKKANPMPAMRNPLGGELTSEYKQWLSNYEKAKATGFKKQGGTMNKVEYFQKGGQTQNDVQRQVEALVEAAIAGDQKAAQQVNQIMQAAKQGDQQAAQLAQMIQTAVQKLQGQTITAKLGAKLQYIKSLKFAKGGKCKTRKKCMKDGGNTVKVAKKDIDKETYQRLSPEQQTDIDIHHLGTATSDNKDGSYNISHKPSAQDSTQISKNIMSKSMSKKYLVKKKCGGVAKKRTAKKECGGVALEKKKCGGVTKKCATKKQCGGVAKKHQTGGEFYFNDKNPMRMSNGRNVVGIVNREIFKNPTNRGISQTIYNQEGRPVVQKDRTSDGGEREIYYNVPKSVKRRGLFGPSYEMGNDTIYISGTPQMFQNSPNMSTAEKRNQAFRFAGI